MIVSIKKIVKVVVIVVALPVVIWFSGMFLMLFGFILSSLDSALSGLVYGKVVNTFSIKSEGECLKSSGEWRAGGLLGKKQCFLKALDESKPCFSGFQCTLGVCEVSADPDVAKEDRYLFFYRGKCRKYTPRFGCTCEANFGVKNMCMCID